MRFGVQQLTNGNDQGVRILSVISDSLLLIGDKGQSLFIHNRDGMQFRTIEVKNLKDAVGTIHGHIAYLTSNNAVVVKSQSGNIISEITMPNPLHISISNDSTMYLTAESRGFFQSSDGGLNWIQVCNLTDKWQPLRVIKVPTEHIDYFWALERNLDNNDTKHHIRIYSVDRRFQYSSVTCRNIAMLDVQFDISHLSSLAYDGNMNIFISDYSNGAVHVFLANGQYNCQILSSSQNSYKMYALAIDSKRQLLHVGLAGGSVDSYKLIYEQYNETLVPKF